MNNYGKEYFASGNYVSYMEREPRYQMIARDLDELWCRIGLVYRDCRILDYGCGPGFLIRSLRNIGYRNVEGCDISEWARCALSDVTIHSHPTECDVMIALDVFEHMRDEEITMAIASANPRVLLARIPCSNGGDDFALAVSRSDKTHINCKSPVDWKRFLANHGFSCVLPLRLSTVFTSAGVYCPMAIRD